MIWQDSDRWRILHDDRTPLAYTDAGGTGITAIDTYTLPGGTMGLNSVLRLTASLALSAVGGQNIHWLWGASDVGFSSISAGHSVILHTLIWNVNDLAVQVGSGGGGRFNVSNAAPFSDTQNTAADVVISVAPNIGAGEGGTLQWWRVEILP